MKVVLKIQQVEATLTLTHSSYTVQKVGYSKTFTANIKTGQMNLLQ